MMWRFLFVSFLIAHGLVHLAIWLVPKPADGKARSTSPTPGSSVI